MNVPFRALLKRIAYRLLEVGGAGKRGIADTNRRGLVTVLCLHRVSPTPNPYWSPLHPRVFEALLSYLTENYQVCTFDELEAGDGPKTGQRPPVVLSFDDGYQDFVEYAMPALSRRGLRVNQNIIVRCVESGLPPWTVQLADFLLAAPSSLLRELRVPGFSKPTPGREPDARARYGAQLSYHLKMRPAAERAPLYEPIEALMKKLGPIRTTRMMSLRDVQEASATHHIGAHSYEHESMGYESDTYFLNDLAKCQAFFNTQLGLPLSTYAFPNGSYRPEQIGQLRGEGISRVLLVEEKFARGSGPIYPRVSITASSRAEARLQASGFRAAGVL